jgi:hypothetical protein
VYTIVALDERVAQVVDTVFEKSLQSAVVKIQVVGIPDPGG